VVRRRVRAPAVVVQTVAFCAPVALCVAVRRSRARDVATCCLQMWAYMAAYKFPHDDPDEQARRVHIDYPIAIDRLLGLGELPTVRLQRALARSGPEGPQWRVLDRVLVWAHWSWFMVPHGALVYVLLRDPRRFDQAAAMTYAVFDLGAAVYWVLPTAPPWYAASAPENGATRPENGATRSETGAVRPENAAARPEDVRADARRQIAARRMMVEYGEFFWGDGWEPLYSVFGGNPLAAMPSLHFATSVMAALLLAETGPLAGALGWAYAGTLGFALVYLGEHYLVDLLAGAALTAAVRSVSPSAGPALTRCGRAVAALEARAHREA
jgi:membrane-associated phospholipid phosphatase